MMQYGLHNKHSPIWDNPLSDLTHQHKQQGGCKQPAQVMARKVQPCVVMDVNLRALAAPAFNTNTFKHDR